MINFDFVNLFFEYLNVAVVDFKNQEKFKCLHKHYKVKSKFCVCQGQFGLGAEE